MSKDNSAEIEAERAIVELLRGHLNRIAREAGATLDERTALHGRDGAESTVFRLWSARPGTAMIEVFPDGAWSIYLSVGYAGSIEVLASPREPEEAIRSTVAIVEAVVAGRLKERVWRVRRDGSVVGSALRIRFEADSRWTPIGQIGAVAPVIGRLLYRCEVVRYEPF